MVYIKPCAYFLRMLMQCEFDSNLTSQLWFPSGIRKRVAHNSTAANYLLQICDINIRIAGCMNWALNRIEELKKFEVFFRLSIELDVFVPLYLIAPKMGSLGWNGCTGRHFSKQLLWCNNRSVQSMTNCYQCNNKSFAYHIGVLTTDKALVAHFSPCGALRFLVCTK